jgi:hypothetical protein
MNDNKYIVLLAVCVVIRVLRVNKIGTRDIPWLLEEVEEKADLEEGLDGNAAEDRKHHR